MCWSSQSEQPDPQVCRWVPKLVVAVADQDQRLLVGLWPQCRGVRKRGEQLVPSAMECPDSVISGRRHHSTCRFPGCQWCLSHEDWGPATCAQAKAAGVWSEDPCGTHIYQQAPNYSQGVFFAQPPHRHHQAFLKGRRRPSAPKRGPYL